MLLRRSIIATSLLAMTVAARADDKDVVARAFHSDPQYVVMNIPPRPEAWPGAIFTANMRIPIAYGKANDPAIRVGTSVAIDSSSGFDLGAKAQGSMSFLFGASADVSDAANIVMSFPDATVYDMDEAALRERVISTKGAIEAAKRGQLPLIVIRSYAGTPTITITRKASASAEAWAKLKQNVNVQGGADASSDNRISYKAGEKFIFAFETCQVTFDPKDLSKEVYTIRFASLPATLYAFREDDEQTKLAAAIAATTGVSVSAIKEHGLLGGEASMFRRNLGIRF
ncbi:hypothetical protein BDS110ZK18_36720 [Bradyrhizobium diazoefficiens]|uniref:Uncharacterized protein n=1 Tax=Bradyrhizobium diazoefficiens TaxID=1355477 RepID=A0A809XIC2_9BRAD|nr:hypothetical protein XF2B_07330 [Bradyrhizobium diazoefficiens]BCF14042.1 hypothetical protein XF13B_07330 [Bradyrhizobium diazoefficiens]